MTPRKQTSGAGASRSAADVEKQLATIEHGDGEGTIDFGRGVSLHVSSLGKTYFPETGVTKGDLMRYYARVSPALLPHLADRPLILKRYPNGIAGPMFFQQDAGAHVPPEIRVKSMRTEEKGMRSRLIGGDLVTLLYTVQLGAIEVHPWLSRVTNIDHPDRCLIDLDPGDDVPFAKVVSLARDVVDLVQQCGLSAAVKTSGSTGMHVVLALPDGTSYDMSVRLASLLAEAAVGLRPELATVERSIRARPKGTIYVDALQNARGKSAASAYSVRAKAAATVSAPITKGELTSRLRMSAFTVRSMPARVRRTGDLWGTALRSRPTSAALARAMQVLEDTLSAPAAPEPARRTKQGGAGGGAGAGGRRAKRG